MVAAAVVALLCGCSLCLPGKNGTTHHVIIGVGVVSVNESVSHAVVITDTNALGVTLTDRPGLKLGVGYTSSFVMTVPDNAQDVRAEVSRSMFGPLLIAVPRAVLVPYSSQRRE